MRILTFSSLFPNDQLPGQGIFVQQRLLRLHDYCAQHGIDLDVRVMAPVPWFPSRNPRFGAYAQHAAVAHRESRFGLEISHPRFPVIPKVGMSLSPTLMYQALRSKVGAMIRSGFCFDLIDAHYFYPDGVAAVLLGRAFNKPVVITGRGTDLNLIPRYRWPARQIRWAAERAAGIITVAEALTGYLQDLGISRDRVTVLRNGVDLDAFRPASDRAALRNELALSGRVLLSAGYLIERKGHHIVIDALAKLAEDRPDLKLLIAGSGEEEGALEAQVRRLGLDERVSFLGFLDQPTLCRYMQAADALVLASSREGWANVLLESMACGTPVVATAIDGTPEVVRDPAAGVLIPAREPDSVANAVRDLFAKYPDRAETRGYAEQFSWDETSAGQVAVFERVLSGKEPSPRTSRSGRQS